MKGSELRLTEFMDGSNRRFIIPVYQRSYNWKKENCAQLYNDLIKIIKNNKKSHFFGSIVSVQSSNGRHTENIIIDGQQRLTTVTLLLLAIYNAIKNKDVECKDETTKEQIYEGFLVNKNQSKETRLKLKSVESDRTAFERLFDEQAEPIPEANITINYKYFYERILKNEISVDDLFNAVYNLEIINIILTGDDNPQLIFESLNSTGVALTEGDKIRNFVLMGLEANIQEEFYNKYWKKIEEYTGHNITVFVRDYLSVKMQKIPAFNKIYMIFKEYIEDKKCDIKIILEDMLLYAKLYKILLFASIDNKIVKGCIYRMNNLETTVTRPFFLEVLKMNNSGEICDDDLSEIFMIIESYIFRRTICDLPTNQLNKIFVLLHKEIKNYDGTTENYLEKLKYTLNSKKEKARFPDNEEFAYEFENKQIYLMNSKNKIYLFERIENFGTVEDKNIYRHIDDGDYTIEHIMPQNLTPTWIKTLGDDYKKIHELWLHRVANLTLTAYNSKYSNHTFLEKRDMQNGFKDSGIRMNQQIACKNNWGLDELKERSSYLTEKALKIWFKPETKYKSEKNQYEVFTLDDDVDLSGKKITMFRYKNYEITTVKNWVDMYEQVIKILYDEDKSIILKLAVQTDDDIGLSNYIATNEKDLREAIKIDNDVYIEKNTTTNLKITLLRKFFRLYKIELSDLMFYIKH